MRYPAWICHACGIQHGRPRDAMATYHEGDACGWCGRNDVPVTEPRDYNYPAWAHTSRDAASRQSTEEK
jgi:hypothetical protein